MLGMTVSGFYETELYYEVIRSFIAVNEQRANKLMLSVAGTMSALCIIAR